MEDKTLICQDCGKEFVFTAGEQRFYAEKGFMNKPKACKACPISCRTKLVASTILLMGRTPAPYRYSRIHMGEGPILTFVMTRAQ